MTRCKLPRSSSGGSSFAHHKHPFVHNSLLAGSDPEGRGTKKKGRNDNPRLLCAPKGTPDRRQPDCSLSWTAPLHTPSPPADQAIGMANMQGWMGGCVLPWRLLFWPFPSRTEEDWWTGGIGHYTHPIPPVAAECCSTVLIVSASNLRSAGDIDVLRRSLVYHESARRLTASHLPRSVLYFAQSK